MEEKRDRVLKLQEYIDKRDRSTSKGKIEECDKNEKSEILKELINEFLDSDKVRDVLDFKQEVSIERDEETGCIENKKSDQTLDIKYKKKCMEVNKLQIKLNHSIPKSIIFYIILSTILSTVFITILLISVIKKIIILDIMSCIVGTISSLGLLGTSIVSIKDWRKFIKDEQKR